MKKKAIIIGNMDPILGVQKDIDTVVTFLKSKEGGCWYDGEIDVIKDAPKYLLESKLSLYKQQNFDYVLVLFGGHGYIQIETTYIYPSHLEKLAISENAFNGLSSRQLSIFDCCRVPRAIQFDSIELSESASLEYFSEQLSIEQVRSIYHNQILSTPEQHLKLYSCSKGEEALDDNGGLYTQTLISIAKKATRNASRFNSVISIHRQTEEIVKNKSANKQNPQFSGLPRRFEKEQLPLSINIKKSLF